MKCDFSSLRVVVPRVVNFPNETALMHNHSVRGLPAPQERERMK